MEYTFRIQEADSVCTGRGLRGTLLENCILDLSLTGDATVVEQQAFQQGLNMVESSFSCLINQLIVGKCPNDCSNHGQCANGTCICVSTWTGEDCSKGMVTITRPVGMGCSLTGIFHAGGCDSCPLNSRCIDGFCHCNIGYFGTECAKGTGFETVLAKKLGSLAFALHAAFCDNVNNCTSPVHGICVETDICKCSPGSDSQYAISSCP